MRYYLSIEFVTNEHNIYEICKLHNSYLKLYCTIFIRNSRKHTLEIMKSLQQLQLKYFVPKINDPDDKSNSSNVRHAYYILYIAFLSNFKLYKLLKEFRLSQTGYKVQADMTCISQKHNRLPPVTDTQTHLLEQTLQKLKFQF